MKNKAIVLQYQNISEDTENFLDTWIYYKSFEEQLDYISKNDIPLIPLEDVDAHIRGSLKLRRQSFSLTFDTGYVELYDICYPLLKKYGYPAAFFIRPDTVGTTDSINGRCVEYMNWNQICELEENGITIGLHGCKGISAASFSLEEIEKEIVESRSLFKEKLGREVVYYSVREGTPTKQMLGLFKREGINAVFCQAPTKQKVNPYAVGRIQIDDNDLNIFLIKISKTYVFFKDSRYFDLSRQVRLDKAIHCVSNIINRLKGKDVI